jgi:hypothetical protein
MHTLTYTESPRPFKRTFLAFELFRLSFLPFSFVRGMTSSLYPSTTDCQTSNLCAFTIIHIHCTLVFLRGNPMWEKTT